MKVAHMVRNETQGRRRARFASALIVGVAGTGKTSLRHRIGRMHSIGDGPTIRAFEQIPDVPLPSTFINALIVVVDANDPVSGEVDDLIEVCDMLGSAIRYVCLFVNKVDAHGDAHGPLLDRFADLEEELQWRCPFAELEMICGSALTGEGAPRLIAGLHRLTDPRVA